MVREKDGSEWLSPKEAAAYLNLSVSRVYHLKRHLTHRKGNTPKSRVLFLKETLLDDYLNI